MSDNTDVPIVSIQCGILYEAPHQRCSFYSVAYIFVPNFRTEYGGDKWGVQIVG